MSNNLGKRGLSFSIIVGTLLVPLTALAALWMTEPGPATESPAVGEFPSTTAVIEPVTSSEGDIAADLQAACGPEGMQLVSLEEAGSITDVQQAALDALREVCDEHGVPLPARPAGEPIVRTVIVPAPTVASTTGTTSLTIDDDRRDDEHEEEEHEEEEHEEHEDHEEHDDHEDDN